MINEIIKLIDPNKFELFFKEEELKDKDYIIVKPRKKKQRNFK